MIGCFLLNAGFGDQEAAASQMGIIEDDDEKSCTFSTEPDLV